MVTTGGGQALGRTVWVVPDGYLPEGGTGGPDMASHEAACVLNTGDRPATLRLTAYFEDRDPAGPYVVEVPAARTLHVRLDRLADPEPLPTGVPYAYVVESDVPVVVQHSRLDSRQAANALMTTVAYAAG